MAHKFIPGLLLYFLLSLSSLILVLNKLFKGITPQDWEESQRFFTPILALYRRENQVQGCSATCPVSQSLWEDQDLTSWNRPLFVSHIKALFTMRHRHSPTSHPLALCSLVSLCQGVGTTQRMQGALQGGRMVRNNWCISSCNRVTSSY